MGSSSSFEMRPLSNVDIEDILKGITNFSGVYSKDMIPKRIEEDESAVINTQMVVALIGCVLLTS